MAKQQQGKKWREAKKQIGENRAEKVEAAIELLKKCSYSKFDGSLEGKVCISYKTLQNVRGIIRLPHGTGKKVRVLVITTADKFEEAKEAGADYVGSTDIIEKIKKENWLDFEACIASPDIMRQMTKIAPILGRKGLMPKPKAGTVTTHFAPVIKSLKLGQYEYRADKTGIIHLKLGKMSYDLKSLEENFTSALEAIIRDKPNEAKGNYIKSFYVKATMSPAIRVISHPLLN